MNAKYLVSVNGTNWATKVGTSAAASVSAESYLDSGHKSVTIEQIEDETLATKTNRLGIIDSIELLANAIDELRKERENAA